MTVKFFKNNDTREFHRVKTDYDIDFSASFMGKSIEVPGNACGVQTEVYRVTEFIRSGDVCTCRGIMLSIIL